MVSLSKAHAYSEEFRARKPTNKRKSDTEIKDCGYLAAETWLNLLPQVTQYAFPEALEQMRAFIQTTLDNNAKANSLINLTYISFKQAEVNKQNMQEDPESEPSDENESTRKAKVPKNQDESGPSGTQKPQALPTFANQLGQVNQEANAYRWKAFKDYFSNLTQEGIKEQVRINPHFHTLRDHQLNALRKVGNKSKAQGPTSGLMKLATGAGKTRIMTEIIHGFFQAEFTGHIALIAPRADIANQLLDEMRKEFDEGKVIAISSATGHTGQKLIEQIRGGALKESDSKIFVFVAQSFENFACRQCENLRYFSLVLVDEIHLATPSQWALYQDCAESEGGVLFGLSATLLECHVDNFPVFYDYNSAQAEKDKINIPWNFYPLTGMTQETLKDPRKCILQELKKPLTKDPTQSLLQFSGMIFVPDIASADALAQFLADHNIKAKAVHSQSTNKMRVLQDFKNLDHEGKPKTTEPVVKILVAVKSLKEGFDATVDYILYCKNIPLQTKSLDIQRQQNELIQIIGRATRKRPEPLAAFHLPEALIYSLPQNQEAFEEIKRLNLDLNSEMDLDESFEANRQTSQNLTQEDTCMPDCLAAGSSKRASVQDMDSEETVSDDFSLF
jgi:superfamily II DNA or RNA helicase